VASEEAQTVIVAEKALKSFCVEVLRKVGVPSDEAVLIVDNLVEADLRGVESHGVVRFPIYVKRIVDGGSNPRPQIRIVRQTRTTAVVDGDNGMGQLVGVRAMEIAIDKASEGDCAFVSVRNSNHFGAAAYYAEMAARRDMIGLVFTIGGINHMTPWGGAEATLGNNPFAVAFPTDRDFPIVLDMACSIAARGKIIVAAKEGTPIPADWASGPDGLPTTDPVEALKGFVLPVGGPKGYALTFTVGLLSTMLSGAYFGREVTHMYDMTETPQNVGHLFGVLPIASFEDLGEYRTRIGKAIRDMHEAKKAPGVERIYVPGEREHLALQARRAEGIPVGVGVFGELREMSEQFDVPLVALGAP
jgi:LDH2 family malate/lactate/ureidoglycolate dehydrogenase